MSRLAVGTPDHGLMLVRSFPPSWICSNGVRVSSRIVWPTRFFRQHGPEPDSARHVCVSNSERGAAAILRVGSMSDGLIAGAGFWVPGSDLVFPAPCSMFRQERT